MADGMTGFEAVRSIVRYLFLYGDSSAKDMANSDMVDSKLTAFKGKLNDIEASLGSRFYERTTIPNRKQDKVGYRLIYDELLCSPDFLTSLFDHHVIDVNDIITYFTFLQLFYDECPKDEDFFHYITNEDFKYFTVEEMLDFFSPKGLNEGSFRGASITADIATIGSKSMNSPYAPSYKDDKLTHYKKSFKSDRLSNIKNKDLINFTYSRGVNALAALSESGDIDIFDFTKLFDDSDSDSPQSRQAVNLAKANAYLTDILGNSNQLLKLSRRCLWPLEENGIIQALDHIRSDTEVDNTAKPKYSKRNPDNSIEYRFRNDIFRYLSKSEAGLKKLLSMVHFFYNNSALSLPGFQLENTLKKYLVYRGYADYDCFSNFDYGVPFSFHGNSVHTIIDNDIMWTLLSARDSLMPVTFTYRPGNTSKRSTTVFPMMIMCEKVYGRQYLFAYVYHERNYQAFRLDWISDVRNADSQQCPLRFLMKTMSAVMSDPSVEGITIDRGRLADIAPDTITLKKIKDGLPGVEKETLSALIERTYKHAVRYAWNINLSQKPKPQQILIHFRFPCPELKNIYRTKVIRTGRHGTITDINDLCFDFNVELYDSSEIIPWIRSFGAYVYVDRNVNTQLHDKIKNQVKEAMQAYESI